MCKETAFLTNFYIRLICGILYALALIPLGLLGNYSGGAILIVINTVFWGSLYSISFKDSGMIGKLLIEEILIGAGIGLGAFISIL